MAAAPSRGPTYKVVLLGELGVGKTSLFRRLKDNSFDEYQTATTGIDSCSKVVKIDGSTVMLSIWDTAGVERFRTLTRNYYRNAHAAVFVYSVSDASSLHYLAQWIKDAQNFAPSATRMLLGNKVDIEPPQAEIDATTSKSFAAAHEFELSSLVSCKTNTGIADAFESLARALHTSPAVSNQQRTASVIPGQELNVDKDLDSSGQNGGGGCRC
uniref:Rab-like3 n=1 Tax=Suberites domuncula TaxID=55567 RepID=A1XKT6_SUBDO|nr:Rab-like3 [Suberites domuncula]